MIRVSSGKLFTHRNTIELSIEINLGKCRFSLDKSIASGICIGKMWIIYSMLHIILELLSKILRTDNGMVNSI